MTYVGIDLHKRQFTVCYRENENEQSFQVFPNDADGLSEFLQSVCCKDRLAVEAVGFGRHFTKTVAPRVRKLVQVHASKYNLVSRSIKKNDMNDAACLAYGLEKGILPIARFRSEAAHQVRSLLSSRFMIVMMRVRILNLMHAMTAREGMTIPKTKMKWKVWRDKVDLNQFEFGDYHSWLALENQLQSSDKNVLALDKEILSAIKTFDGYDVLSNIPKFGPITVATLLAYIDGIENFQSSKSLCAYFGIVPRSRYSDDQPVPNRKYGRFRSGAITREGDKQARTAIVMSVNRVMMHNESLRAFYARIKGRKGYRKARTAAARKLLTFVFFALKENRVVRDFEAIDFSKPHKVPPQ